MTSLLGPSRTVEVYICYRSITRTYWTVLKTSIIHQFVLLFALYISADAFMVWNLYDSCYILAQHGNKWYSFAGRKHFTLQIYHCSWCFGSNTIGLWHHKPCRSIHALWACFVGGAAWGAHPVTLIQTWGTQNWRRRELPCPGKYASLWTKRALHP